MDTEFRLLVHQTKGESCDGKHIDTDGLTAAMECGKIAWAGLDVTDPEPLPPGHPLWQLPNCILTPHTANTEQMLMARLADRITANVLQFAAGEQLHGQIDQAVGYSRDGRAPEWHFERAASIARFRLVLQRARSGTGSAAE